MDAGSKIKTFMVALAATFAAASSVHSDDAETTLPCKSKQCQTLAGLAVPCIHGVCCDGQVGEAGKCPASQCAVETVFSCDAMSLAMSPAHAGFAAFVSDWFSKSPKFSAEVAIHFGTSPLSQNKLSSDLPMVDLQSKDIVKVNNTQLEQIPQIAKPMRFTERIPRIQLGELTGDVIICGHRICSGTKCYDVKDEPIAGAACDKTEEAIANQRGEEEQILVLPMAPPAPPGVNIAFCGNENTETEAASILRNSGLSGVNISLPVTTVVDLIVAKTELSTRLEMTCQLMDERQMAMEHIQSLANRNASLSTQLAVAEARNQMSDALTASVVERAELAIRLACVEPKTSKLQGSINVVQTIQEDLSNIRRQIALLRRSPVPFAPSYVGMQTLQPYVPTAQLPVSQLKDSDTACSGDELDCARATTVK